MKDLKDQYYPHTLNEDQKERIEKLRTIHLLAAQSVRDNCEESRDKEIAFTKLEESLMWAVKSIALEGVKDA